jgi:hypothetical protein
MGKIQYKTVPDSISGTVRFSDEFYADGQAFSR